jgi:hypothetical protein
MNRLDKKGSKAPKLIFPTWKSLIIELVNQYADAKGLNRSDISKMISAYDQKFQVVKKLIKSQSPIITMGSALVTEGNYYAGPSIYDQLHKLRDIKLSTNEFFAIYDIEEKKYSYVDPDIESCLGIDPNKFTIQSVLGILPSDNLCLAEDSPHKIRWAGIAYLILAMPAFTFRSLGEYFKISFRINTQSSSREDLRKAGIAVLEKCCYLTISDDIPNNNQPRFHIDRCSVLDKSSFSYVRPTFVSDFVQSEYLNALAYLINAELLDISPKYALLLDEKARNDRNKAISNEVNAALKSISNIHEIEISENQVADAFSKTIRDKTAEALTLWRKPVKPFEAVSDSDAVEYGKILGLVSMPAKVKKLLYESIDIGQE